MKAEILQRWEIELPEPGEDTWFLDWVLRAPKQAGQHLACSLRTLESVLDVYPAMTIDSVLEYFGGLGAQALIVEDLFSPGVHVVADYSSEAVEHMKRALPSSVVVRQGDAYDPANDDSAGLVVLDFGDLTAWKAQPSTPRGGLLDRVFAHEPMAVVLTDIAARYLHLQKKSYEPILGQGTCESYPQYLRAFADHLQARYGYVLHEANYTRWSAVMSFIPEALSTKYSGGIHQLPPSDPGLVLS